MNKKALVVISFGSTFDETRRLDIGGIEAALATALPDYDQYRSFTSKIIRKRLASRGIFIDDTEAVLIKLQELGYEEVLLQPTHLLHGEEFEHKVQGAIHALLQENHHQSAPYLEPKRLQTRRQGYFRAASCAQGGGGSYPYGARHS